MLSFPSLLFSESFSHQPNKPFRIEKQKTKKIERSEQESPRPNREEMEEKEGHGIGM